jgi:putative inorganic carbon (HCO3(-)) transporter
VEIVAFLHLSIRRIIALAVLAVFVALPTAAVLLRGPSQYKAAVDVRIGQFIPSSVGSGIQTQMESDFQTALGVPQVQRDIAQRMGLSVKHLNNRLAVAQPGHGTTIKVTFTDPDQRQAVAVARAAAVQALTFLAQQQVDNAAGTLTAADQRVADALAQLATFASTTGVGAVDDRIRALAQEQLRLQDRRVLAGSTADGGTIATLASKTDAELAGLLAVEPAYNQLSRSFQQALGGAHDATARYTAATSALASASSGSVVALDALSPVGKLKRTILYGFGAGLIAVLVAVAVLAVEELRRRQLLPEAAADQGRPARALRAFGERMLDRLTPSTVAAAGLVLLVPIGVGLGIGLTVLMGQSRTTLALVLAAPIGLVAGILAFTHFEVFLAAMVILRSSLDSLKVSGGGGLDPGVVMGGVFIVAGVLWLAAQRRAGRWVPVSRSTWALWIFAAACAISVPTSMRIGGSAVASTRVIAGVLMFSVLEQYLGQRPHRARLLIVCLFLSLVVPAAVGLRQWVTNHGNTYTAGVSRVAGTFVHPASFADFLLLLLPMAALLVVSYRGWFRTVMCAVLAVAAGLLLVTYTREAWLAAIVSLLYLGIRARREVLYAMIGGLLVLLVAVPSVSSRFADLHATAVAPGVPNNSLSWRIGYWRQLVPMAGINPVTGIGFDVVQRVRPEQLQPHNVFVEAYVETGVFGLLALLLVIWSFAGDLHRRLRDAMQGWDRLLALAAVSVALGILAGFPGENLLTQTFVYWYAAVAMTFGYRGARTTSDAASADAGHSAPAQEAAVPEQGLLTVH